MIYLLFVLLVIILAISYYLGGKDFFAPSTVQILSFAGSVFMCIYFMWSMNCPHEFHWETIGMITAAMAISMVLGVFIHWMFSRIKIPAYTPDSVRISPISNKVSFVFLIVSLITVIWFLIEIRRIGGASGDFSMIMSRFHALNSYSTEKEGRLPWLLNQLISLAEVLFLLYSFELLRFYRELPMWRKWTGLLIIGLCVLILLLTGKRTPLIHGLIGSFAVFHLLRIQKQGRYRPYSFKYFLRAVVLVVLVLAAFFLLKSFVGRTGKNETMNMAEYVSFYIGSGFIALDKYLQFPPAPSSIFGKETFHAIIDFLSRYGLIDVPMYIGHKEFRPVGGGISSNVYTFLRSYHYDFGMAGTFILHGISVAFLSIFYEYTKKKRGNVGILIFSLMYHSIVMSFFVERFFQDVICMNFVKKAVMTVVLYELTIRKRLRISFHRTEMNAQISQRIS